jgi:hypothetical protein
MNKTLGLDAALAIFIPLGFFLTIFAYTSAIELALSLLVATIVSMPGVGRLMHKGDIFDPLVLMTLLFAIAIPLSIIYILIDPASSVATVFGIVPSAVISKAILFSSLAMACLVAGFYFGAYLIPYKKCRKDRTIIIPNFIVTRLIRLYWLSVVFRLVTLSSGYGTFFVKDALNTDPLSNFKGITNSFNYIVFLLAVLAIFLNGERRYLKRVLPMLLIQVGIGILIGSKAAALTPMISFVFAYSVGRRTIRKSIWTIASLLVVVLIITSMIFPIVSAYRSNTTSPDLQALLKSANEVASPSAISLLDVLGRISWLPSIANTIYAVPEFIPFAYGQTIWPAFSWFVPRIIWANKPVLSMGAWYAHEILGWDPLSPSEAGLTLWGEAYLNFGLLGMVLMGFSMGFLFWYVYAALYKSRLHLYAILTYFLFINTFILGFERNLAILVASFGQSLLISFIIWCLVSLKLDRKFKKKNNAQSHVLINE